MNLQKKERDDKRLHLYTDVSSIRRGYSRNMFIHHNIGYNLYSHKWFKKYILNGLREKYDNHVERTYNNHRYMVFTNLCSRDSYSGRKLSRKGRYYTLCYQFTQDIWCVGSVGTTNNNDYHFVDEMLSFLDKSHVEPIGELCLE